MIVDVNEEIKRSVTMSEICDRYGIEVNRSGYAVCPFHGEKTPSLKVYPGRRGWHCFGCGQGGDVIDFVQRYYQLGLKDAQRKINEDFGLHILMGATDYRARMAAGRAAAERRKAAADRQRREDAIERRYWEAFDRVKALEGAILAKRPASPDDEPSEEWLGLLTRMSGAQLALDAAETERMRYAYARDHAGHDGAHTIHG